MDATAKTGVAAAGIVGGLLLLGGVIALVATSGGPGKPPAGGAASGGTAGDAWTLGDLARHLRGRGLSFLVVDDPDHGTYFAFASGADLAELGRIDNALRGGTDPGAAKRYDGLVGARMGLDSRMWRGRVRVRRCASREAAEAAVFRMREARELRDNGAGTGGHVHAWGDFAFASLTGSAGDAACVAEIRGVLP